MPISHALIRELDRIAENPTQNPVVWSKEENAVLAHYATRTNSNRTLVQIMKKAFPGRRNYTVEAVGHRKSRMP